MSKVRVSDFQKFACTNVYVLQIRMQLLGNADLRIYEFRMFELFEDFQVSGCKSSWGRASECPVLCSSSYEFWMYVCSKLELAIHVFLIYGFWLFKLPISCALTFSNGNSFKFTFVFVRILCRIVNFTILSCYLVFIYVRSCKCRWVVSLNLSARTFCTLSWIWLSVFSD